MSAVLGLRCHYCRELACAVLSRDFGLDVVLPVDRLVPMVPQRLNYIHWLEDLLQEERQTEKQIFGIDIGLSANKTLCQRPRRHVG